MSGSNVSTLRDLPEEAATESHRHWTVGAKGMVRQIQPWLLIVGAWCVLAMIETGLSYSESTLTRKNVRWLDVARIQFASCLIWGAIITPLILWICRRYPIDRQNWKRRLPLYLLAELGAGIVHASLRVATSHWVYPAGHPIGWAMFRGLFRANADFDMWSFWVVVGIFHVVRYYQRYRDRELQASLLEVQLSRTQLEVLRAQLQPHFLFNTLHSIAALMHEDVGGADRMIARLSDLLRMTLENGAVQEVALKSELEFLDGYLDIEKTRFQDRLMVEEQIAPEALDCGVPNMILQPIVENAIRHGIARKSSPGKIEIRAAKSDGWLALTISDDGPGADATQVAGGKGRGLANTRARLKCLYGEKQRFVTKQRPGGGMEVEMLIPAKLMQDEAPGTLTKTWIARPTPP